METDKREMDRANASPSPTEANRKPWKPAGRSRKNTYDSFTSSASGSPQDTRVPAPQGAGPHHNATGATQTDDDTGFLCLETSTLLDGPRYLSIEAMEARGNLCRALNMTKALFGFVMVLVSTSMFGQIYWHWIKQHFNRLYPSNITQANTTVIDPQCEDYLNISAESLPEELDVASTKVEIFLLWSILAEVVPAIFSCVFMGAFSNKTGRKILFILPTAGILVRQAVAIAVIHWELNINFLFLGLGISGGCGSVVGLTMAVYIYITDNTRPAWTRSLVMVIAQALTTVCLVAPLVGVDFIMSSPFNPLWHLVAALGTTAVALLWFLGVLRESVIYRSRFFNCVERLETVKNVFKFYLTTNYDGPLPHQRVEFVFLGLVFFIAGSCFRANSVEGYYLTMYPFCWTELTSKVTIIMQGVLQGICSVAVVAILQRLMIDEHICVLALFFAGLSRALFAAALSDNSIYIALALGLVDSLVLPLTRSILSKMAPDGKRGSLFASMAVIELGTVAGGQAGLMTLFRHTVGSMRNITFIVMATSFIVSCLLMLVQAGISRARHIASLMAVEVVRGVMVNQHRTPQRPTAGSSGTVLITTGSDQ